MKLISNQTDRNAQVSIDMNKLSDDLNTGAEELNIVVSKIQRLFNGKE